MPAEVGIHFKSIETAVMGSTMQLFEDIEYVGHRISYSESKNGPVIGSTLFRTKEELDAVTEDELKTNKDLQKMHQYGWHKNSAFYKEMMAIWKFPKKECFSAEVNDDNDVSPSMKVKITDNLQKYQDEMKLKIGQELVDAMLLSCVRILYYKISNK